MIADPREDLITSAQDFYEQRLMVGTAGNLSAKIDDQTFWITASGRHKGRLTPHDFLRLDLDGNIIEQPNPDLKPSAETSIHLAIYNSFPEAKACYHVHSIEAKLASRFTETSHLEIPPIEMLKGLDIWEENPQVSMRVFKNYLEVPKIAAEIRAEFSQNPPQVPALLIQDHGVTVWGNCANKAYHYIEIVEYIFRYMVTARQIKI